MQLELAVVTYDVIVITSGYVILTVQSHDRINLTDGWSRDLFFFFQIISIGNVDNLHGELDRLESAYNVERVQLEKSQILIPGLVDTHIHGPQYPNAGLGYDRTLLDWLTAYTFKLEKQYRNLDFARKVFDLLVVRLLWYIKWFQWLTKKKYIKSENPWITVPPPRVTLVRCTLTPLWHWSIRWSDTARGRWWAKSTWPNHRSRTMWRTKKRPWIVRWRLWQVSLHDRL